MTKEYKIEKNVPLPAKRGKGLFGIVRSMECGDSVFVENGKQKTVSATGRVATKITGHKFTTRMVEGGVRIWRVL